MSFFLFAVGRGRVMPWIRIVIDDVISSRYAHVHNVMRARHLSYKVRRWLAGLCLDGRTLHFCRSEFNVFFFNDTEVCLRCLGLARVHSAFAIAVRSGVECSLEWEDIDRISLRLGGKILVCIWNLTHSRLMGNLASLLDKITFEMNLVECISQHS